MRADIDTVKKIYSDKVNLIPTDLIQISIIGNQAPEKIRPIRLTFHNPEKRSEVLRKNKHLILEDDEFPECTEEFCDDHESNHKHIYVNTDKTKQQREEEKTLRNELKVRKSNGELNLIIRNNKIIKRYTDTSHTRWVDFIKNAY